MQTKTNEHKKNRTRNYTEGSNHRSFSGCLCGGGGGRRSGAVILTGVAVVVVVVVAIVRIVDEKREGRESGLSGLLQATDVGLVVGVEELIALELAAIRHGRDAVNDARVLQELAADWRRGPVAGRRVLAYRPVGRQRLLIVRLDERRRHARQRRHVVVDVHIVVVVLWL